MVAKSDQGDQGDRKPEVRETGATESQPQMFASTGMLANVPC